MAAETRCWPLDLEVERVDPASVAVVTPVAATASGRVAATICVSIRPTAVPGEVALHVIRRDGEGDVELLKREGGIAQLDVDTSWAAWSGRVDVLPGWTEEAPLVDVTGDGRANLLVRARLSGECCERWFVLEFGHEVRVLFDDLAGHEGGRSTRVSARQAFDVEGDGWPEIVATDALAWPAPCSFVLAAPPQVVTVFGFDRRLRAYAPIAPSGLAVHEATLREALQRLLGEPASWTLLERSAWLLPEFWLGGDVALAASWCDVLPLVTALLAAGRERDAWAAFDVWYRGDDHAEVKAWLQASWWWAAPWRWAQGLATFAGEWIGELRTYVVDADSAFDALGGGRPVDVSVWGEGAVGERVGELRVLGRDVEQLTPACPLLRGLDRLDGFVLIDGCHGSRRYVLRPTASGTAVWLEAMSDPHDPTLRSGAHLVRVHEPRASSGSDVEVLTFGERLLRASCRGLRLLRNELFARRGWVFGTGALADAFASERWYVPAGDASDRDVVNAEIAATLSRHDRAAAHLLVGLERARECDQASFGLEELVAVSEDHLRSLAPAQANELTGEALAWQSYLSACASRGGQAAEACREAVLAERLRRLHTAFMEVTE